PARRSRGRDLDIPARRDRKNRPTDPPSTDVEPTLVAPNTGAMEPSLDRRRFPSTSALPVSTQGATTMTTIVTRRRAVLGFFLAASFVGATLAAPPFIGVPGPNPKAPGLTTPNILTPELAEIVVAQGSHALENPATVDLGGGSSIGVTHYGYYNDGPLVALPFTPPGCTTPVEAKKSEPDKNTYLVFRHGLPGADPDYDYGRHFLFQGHEAGPNSSTIGNNSIGYLTRINLDADAAHHVTLIATTDVDGNPIPAID